MVCAVSHTNHAQIIPGSSVACTRAGSTWGDADLLAHASVMLRTGGHFLCFCGLADKRYATRPNPSLDSSIRRHRPHPLFNFFKVKNTPERLTCLCGVVAREIVRTQCSERMDSSVRQYALSTSSTATDCCASMCFRKEVRDRCQRMGGVKLS